jgi:hypothetical protein
MQPQLHVLWDRGYVIVCYWSGPLDSVLSTLPVFIRRLEVQTYLHRNSPSKDGRARHGVPSFIEQVNFSMIDILFWLVCLWVLPCNGTAVSLPHGANPSHVGICTASADTLSISSVSSAFNGTVQYTSQLYCPLTFICLTQHLGASYGTTDQSVPMSHAFSVSSCLSTFLVLHGWGIGPYSCL